MIHKDGYIHVRWDSKRQASRTLSASAPVCCSKRRDQRREDSRGWNPTGSITVYLHSSLDGKSPFHSRLQTNWIKTWRQMIQYSTALTQIRSQHTLQRLKRYIRFETISPEGPLSSWSCRVCSNFRFSEDFLDLGHDPVIQSWATDQTRNTLTDAFILFIYKALTQSLKAQRIFAKSH